MLVVTQNSTLQVAMGNPDVQPDPTPVVKTVALQWRSVVLALALMVCGFEPPLTAAAEQYTEGAVKAIFLYRIAGYVTWPASMANVPQFTIAVLDAENVAQQLKEFLPQHPIQGMPARVVTIQGLDQLGDSQILYIGPGFTGKLSVLLQTLKDRPILIVTDQPGALDEGSTVNFLLEEQHVRFEISTAAAKRAGLLIGSRLLAVAERVKTGDRRGRSICRWFANNDLPCAPQLAARMSPLRDCEGS
jgi:hypothetical protein